MPADRSPPQCQFVNIKSDEISTPEQHHDFFTPVESFTAAGTTSATESPARFASVNVFCSYSSCHGFELSTTEKSRMPVVSRGNATPEKTSSRTSVLSGASKSSTNWSPGK